MNSGRFSEILFEAITETDDEFIIEAEAACSRNSEKISYMRNPTKNRFLMTAACFVFIVAASVPAVMFFSGDFKNFAAKDAECIAEFDDFDSDIAEPEIEIEAAIEDSINSSEEGSEIISKTEEFNGYIIHMNYYNGYALDDPSKDPKELLSLMKITEINEKDYCIVAVRNERIKVYDAETLELLADNEGTSVNDVALELGIAD